MLVGSLPVPSYCSRGAPNLKLGSPSAIGWPSCSVSQGDVVQGPLFTPVPVHRTLRLALDCLL